MSALSLLIPTLSANILIYFTANLRPLPSPFYVYRSFACLSVDHMCAWYPQKPEEGVATSGMELQTSVSYRVVAEDTLKEQPMEIHRTQTKNMDGDKLLACPS